MTKIYTDCMIDFETLSTCPQAVTIQAGWVFFNREEQTIDNFTGTGLILHIQNQIDNDRVIDADTLKFWSGEDNGLFKQLLSGEVTLMGFIDTFNGDWSAYADEETQLWANGQDFDISIVRDIYRSHGCDVPFKYNAGKDMRTAALFQPDVEYVKSVVKHDALSDAIAQAETVQRLFKAQSDLAEKAWQYYDLNK